MDKFKGQNILSFAKELPNDDDWNPEKADQ